MAGQITTVEILYTVIERHSVLSVGIEKRFQTLYFLRTH